MDLNGKEHLGRWNPIACMACVTGRQDSFWTGACIRCILARDIDLNVRNEDLELHCLSRIEI